MMLTCQACGARASLDVLITNEAARSAVMAALQCPAPLGEKLLQYLGLFRPKERQLTMERVAKLLHELLPDIKAGRIQRGGLVFEAPVEAWLWAIEQCLDARNSGRLVPPLKTHGYLYEVLSRWKPDVGGALAPISAAVGGASATISAAKAAPTSSKTMKGIQALEEMKRERRNR